jgi:serine/threonine protein kinase
MADPASKLAGVKLNGGWIVGALIPRSPSSTGGHFSHAYHVRSGDGTEAFLKALDYTAALKSPDPARALEALTTAYNFERDLLARCARMDRIVKAITHGSVEVEGYPVQYLIFELADGDVRSFMAASHRIDLAWILRTLHQVATGLWQLHRSGIAHQDLKPSNILVFNASSSKLADLGRAACADQQSPHDNLNCAGDLSYAPPELLYGHIPTDWRQRRLGCDAYLLGSMLAFFFTGLNMNALILGQLHEDHSWAKWHGTFEDVLPYVRDAFSRAIVVI